MASKASPEERPKAHPDMHQGVDLRELFRAQAAALGDHPAYVFLGSDLETSLALSYNQLGQAAEILAQKLSFCTRPGDRVLLAFNNDLEAVQLFWSCILARVIPIPAPAPDDKNLKGNAARLRGIAADGDVALALTHESHVEAGRAQVSSVPWLSLQGLLAASRSSLPATLKQEAEGHTEIAYLQYTSGSTSAPRGVKISHGNLLAQCHALVNNLKTRPERGLIWLPWFHDYGLVHGVVLPVYLGGTSFLMSTTNFQLRPLRWLEAIAKHRVTHSGAPDFAYVACVQALARSPGWTAELDCWELASCGAEPVRFATLDTFATSFAPFGFDKTALAPSYGLAEAVLAVTVKNSHAKVLQVTVDAGAIERQEILAAPLGAPGTRTLVGCGGALQGYQLKIVDPDTHLPCAPDRVGEIWVAGPSVGQGYWGQPEASAEHFGAVLAGEDCDSTPYLRTGDLGFLQEGELFIAGRRKDLIVVSGRNLFPQDLEQTAETAHQNIRSGGVTAIAVDKGQAETVVMLVECSRRPSPEVVHQLIESVRKRIAVEHQLEVSDIVPLPNGTLPRTSSGKPQRGAARLLYVQGELDGFRLEAKRPLQVAMVADNECDAATMGALTQMWAEVLGQDEIDPDANFFDLGGDSLLATQLVSRVRARLGVELPISTLFESPTVREITHLVGKMPSTVPKPEGSTMAETALPIGPRLPGTKVTLSYSQERMWFMNELAPESSAYNVPLAIRLRGPLNVPAMRAAFTRVIERHEVLRTQFFKSSEGLQGEVVPASPASIEEVWLSQDAGPVSNEMLHGHLAKVAGLPFRLNQCPLFRVQVIHVDNQEAVLLIVMHHIVSDQWSFAELGRELATHYSAFQAGTDPALPSLPIQYADYANWHRGWFEGQRRSNEMAYWSQRLDGLEPLPLNGDFPQQPTQSFRGASMRMPFSPEHIAALRRLGATHDASLSMVLIAALNVMLHRHTGKEDIAIGVPIANRHHLASENLLGSFVNTLVFRTDLSGDPDFRAVLLRVREISLEAFAHQDMPFELLVRELSRKTGCGRQPLFNVMFNMVNSQVRDGQFEGLSWSRLDFDRASTQFDLTFVADLLYDNAIVIEYSTDLFAADTVRRMASHFERILLAAVAEPDTRVATLPLLGVAELATLNLWSSGPMEPPTSTSVVEWIANGLQISPNHTAVVFGIERMTHQELDEASNRLARLMRQRGISRGSRVGVCLPRGLDLVISLLATLKTGAAYVPLDPDYPSHRIAHQIIDAQLALAITEGPLALAGEVPPCLQLDVERSLIASTAATPLEADPHKDANAEDPAYVIYTSGSTGKPKGVAVPHRAVVNLLVSMARTPGLGADDRLLAVTTPGFDISVLELFLPLGVGATVVIADDAQASDGRALADVIVSERISVLQATPTRWHLLIEAGWAGNPKLKALVGGETLTSSLAAQLVNRCAEVWNMYGPTETTVWSSCWRVTPDAVKSIDLGRPVLNTSIQVLDELLQPCPIGVPGEIYIGGTGLALGYHNNEKLTAERFIARPGNKTADNPLVYRTGDRGRWRYDGSLEHGGRLDDQIKLRGFRVELGEIETNLQSHPDVARAVVMLREDLPGQAKLVAYVTPRDSMPTREALRDHLRQWLPDHMVPSLFVELASIPVLPNGKTDRRTLPAPPHDTPSSGTSPAAPGNDTEATILDIWKAVLETDHLGIHDNFFDLGGHSILAVRVVSQIELALKRPCALALLFKYPTVAELAEALGQERTEDQVDRPVAVLQPHGQGPSLFLLAGADMYRHLAQQLDPDMPVYGVFSQTEIDLLQWPADVAPPEVSVETLAQEYLALIRSIQPHGPYFFGGFSIGGPIAFEVAQRLRKMGEEIGLVILLDSKLPGRGFKHLAAGLHRRLRLFRRQGLNHLLHIYRIYRHQTEHRHQPGNRRNQAYAKAIRGYDAAASDLPVLFLQAGDDASTTPAYGWKSLVPALIVERVPGKHMEILEPPNVAVTASQIRKHLAEARSASALGIQAGDSAVQSGPTQRTASP